MRRTNLLPLLLAGTATAAPAYPSNYPVVDLGYAKYGGSISNGVSSWNGIYYAASPEGSLRWQPPVDIEKKNSYSRDKVINATQTGPQCLQADTISLANFDVLGFGISNTTQSENCLLLNVHKPSAPVSNKLPVLVQIHGGGYAQGSAEQVPGSYLVSQSRGNIIYVEIQYRLGGLGFLNSREIQQQGTANAGLLDQVAALGWVQRHIAAFGGDPDKVTIIGGSAGGGSVTAQLQINSGVAKPPFRAAVAELPWWQNFHTDTVVESQYKDLLTATKCADVTCLRKLPLKDLANGINYTIYNGYDKGLFGYGDFYYGPSVDGKVIKELPSSAFTNGRFAKVPLWIDHDGLEGLVFSNQTQTSVRDLQTDLHHLWPLGNTSFLSSISKLYPPANFSTAAYFATPTIAAAAPNTTLGQLLNTVLPGLANDYNTRNGVYFSRQTIFGDAFINCGTRTVASSFVAAGYPNVWKTVFNTGLLIHGAIQAATLSPPSPLLGGQAINSMLQAYLLSFTIEADPNKAQAFADVKRPSWDSYGAQAKVLQWSEGGSVGVVPDPDNGPRCDFWLKNGGVIRN